MRLAHLGAAGRHDRATEVSGAGPHVDDVIGRRDDAHVVFDHDDRVARIDQAVELEHEAVDIGRVQPGRRLVEDVERAPALPPLQFGRELDPLGLPAGEFGRRLAQAQVAEAEKASQARSTVSPSTSAMVSPLQVTASVSGA